MPKVRYLGKKQVHVDQLYNTNLVWEGHHDVKFVSNESVAARMAENHPDVYEIVRGAVSKPVVAAAAVAATPKMERIRIQDINKTLVPATEATRESLINFARDQCGLQIAAGQTKAEILLTLENMAHLHDENTAAAAKANGPAPAKPAKPADPAMPPTPKPETRKGRGKRLVAETVEKTVELVDDAW